MGTSSKILGGWTPYSSDISAEAQSVFDKIKFPLGMRYTSVAVATQVVAGVNYSFFCNSKIANPIAFNEARMVNVYVDTHGNVGEPTITTI
jgi:hypothetical protein